MRIDVIISSSPTGREALPVRTEPEKQLQFDGLVPEYPGAVPPGKS